MHHNERYDQRDWRAARRGFGAFGRGFGPFGQDFGGGRGRGGNAFRIGRMLADGDLRLIVLALIDEAPRHGYDIIKALEEKSSGLYSPSPGVVYPTLTYLEETGFATSASDGNKKVYSITEAGRSHLQENREVVDTVLNGMEKFGKKFAKAREWFDWSDHGDPKSRQDQTSDRDIPNVLPEVNEARRDLKAAIAEKLDAPNGEQRRVAGILRRAAAEIRAIAGKSPADPVDLG